MPKTVTALSVFLASPGDVKEEREIAREVINSFDHDLWDSRAVCLRVLRWEDTPSGLGDPQSLINEYSENADLVVVIFNRRFGSPTANYASGTLEEFEEAKSKWESRGTPRVKIFFRQLDPETLKDPGQEVAKVIEFRKRFWQQRLGLYVDYSSTRDFEYKFRSELTKWLGEVTQEKDAASPSGGADGSMPQLEGPFIGRDEEVENICELLRRSDVPVVTVHGFPGIGKSSLAVRAATELKGEYGGRLIYVDLSKVPGDQDIIPTIADKLGVRIAKDVDLIKSVKENLRNRQTLLLLDHLDHVHEAAQQLAPLVGSTPGLKMLLTSHGPLRLTGESACRVEQLSFPGLEEVKGLPAKEVLKRYSAVNLFNELMCLKNPGFRLTDRNVRTVADICSQLDGLPLAIKLAVHSIGLRPLSENSSELKRLRRGMKQLEAAFMLSYGMLKLGEKIVFRRLSAFAGGFTLEAADAVCGLNGEDGADVIDELESLIDRGLLQPKTQAGGGIRLTMLNTIREFAQSRLDEEEPPDERRGLRRRHATFYLERAEEAAPRLHSAEREKQGWQESLNTESGNLSAALAWSLSEEGDSATGLRLVGALFWFWNLQGKLEEGRRWAEAALQRVDDSGQSVALAKALYCLGGLYFLQGDYEEAQKLLKRSVDLWRTFSGHERDLGLALAVLGMTLLQQEKNKHEDARACEEESATIFEGLGDTWGQALSLNDLGNVEKEAARYEEAQRHYEASLAKWEQLNDSWGRSLALSNMGDLAYRRGHYGTARRMLRDALDIQRNRGDKWGIAWSLNMLGRVDAKYPDYEKAATHFRESLLLHRELGRKHMIAYCLEGLARVACAKEDYRRVAVLVAASEALRKSIVAPMSSDEEGEQAQIMETARANLDAPSLKASSARGGNMSLEEAIDYAMEAG